MRQINFYELTRPVQERFKDSLASKAAPVPLLSSKGGRRTALGWLVGCVMSVSLLVAQLRYALGDLESSHAIFPPIAALAFGACLAAALFSGLRTWSLWHEEHSLPFEPGVYLFPSGVIDARRYLLRVFSFLEATKVEATTGSAIQVAFEGQPPFRFAVTGSEKREQVLRALDEGRQTFERVSSAPQRKGLAALDPLEDAGFANPFLPKNSLYRRASLVSRLGMPLTVLLGMAMGPLLLRWRNAESDSRMLAQARTRDSVGAYSAYLQRGGRSPDVSEVWLPRAELRDAEREGTVEAIERYIERHPKTNIEREERAALRTQLLAELERAKQVGTLTALHQFKTRRPDHGLDRELREAMHVMFVSAGDDYRKRAADREHVLPFVERLLTYAEQHGPDVVLRFGRKWPRALDKADQEVARSRYFMGSASLPSRYFDEAHARKREGELGQVLTARFADAFAPDILAFAPGDPIPEGADALPNVTVPTLFVEHSAELSGGSYPIERPRGVYISVGFTFEVTFKIPDDAKPLRFKIAVWRPPDLAQTRSSDATEEKVYDSMAHDGFAQFAKKFWAIFFKG